MIKNNFPKKLRNKISIKDWQMMTIKRKYKTIKIKKERRTNLKIMIFMPKISMMKVLHRDMKAQNRRQNQVKFFHKFKDFNLIRKG